MDDNTKRYFRIVILLGIVFLPFIIIRATSTIGEAFKLIISATLIFIPIAVIMVRFKLYEMSEFSKKYSRIIGYAIICILFIIVKKIPIFIQLHLVIIAFQVLGLAYYLIFVKKRNVLSDK